MNLFQQSGYPSLFSVEYDGLSVNALTAFMQKKEVLHYLHVHVSQYLEGKQIMLILQTTKRNMIGMPLKLHNAD